MELSKALKAVRYFKRQLEMLDNTRVDLVSAEVWRLMCLYKLDENQAYVKQNI